MNTVCLLHLCFRLDDIAVGEPFFNEYDVGTFDTGRVYVLYQRAQVCTGGECMCYIREHRCVQGASVCAISESTGVYRERVYVLYQRAQVCTGV